MSVGRQGTGWEGEGALTLHGRGVAAGTSASCNTEPSTSSRCQEQPSTVRLAPFQQVCKLTLCHADVPCQQDAAMSHPPAGLQQISQPVPCTDLGLQVACHRLRHPHNVVCRAATKDYWR